MDDDTKINETIKEIALKHGVALSKDDPILILQTMNDRLMQESIEAQQSNLNDFKSELEVTLNMWSNEAKSKAERTLTAAIAASKVTITESINENAKITANITKVELEKIMENSWQPAINETKLISLINITAATMVLISAIIVLYVHLN